MIAGAVSDATLLDAYRATNTANGTGPQLAVQEMTDDLAAWQQIEVLEPTADTGALALLFCGAAQVEAWADHVVGPDALPGSRADAAARS